MYLKYTYNNIKLYVCTYMYVLIHKLPVFPYDKGGSIKTVYLVLFHSNKYDLSVDYSFYIPELYISLINNSSLSSSPFLMEYYAIIEALNLISFLLLNIFLIASDLMSCLQSLSFNPFNSHLSPLVLRIKTILFSLCQSGFIIQFLWVSSHVDIYSNEVADFLAKFSSNLISS